MSIKELPSIIAGTVTGAAVAVGVVLLWSLVWPSHPDATLHLDGGRLLGQASGRVDRIDPESRTVSVSASVFRLRETVFQITDDTVIVVRGTRGGVGDLADASVRVSYELRGTNRIASLIEVSRPGTATPETTLEPSVAPADAADTPKGVAPNADVPAEGARPAEATISPARPQVVEQGGEPSPGAASIAVPTPRPPAVTRRANTAPAAASGGVSELARNAPAARPAVPSTSDNADGTSAIDWLLKDARGR